VEQHNSCYLPDPRDGWGLLLGPSPGAAGAFIVPAVIHDFFILRVRLCGDLTTVEQHSACYLPEPRDVQGPLLGLIVGVAGALSVSCYL
jgi:hypothetical protein